MPAEVRESFVGGVAEGLRRYLPFGMGLLVVGLPAFGLAVLAHFVLGISAHMTTGAAAAGTVVSAILRLTRR